MNRTTHISTLAQLRALSPHRGLRPIEALGIAERQASLLLRLSDVASAPVPLSILSALPRLELAADRSLPTSGMSYWTGRAWRLAAKAEDHPHRQRFTLAHEFKHVIDHPRRDLLYADHRTREIVADYFAACLLMPKRMVTSAWCAGEQDLQTLADHFEVSVQAMERRVADLGLVDVRRSARYLCRRGPRPLQPRAQLAIAGSTTIGAAP